jgi:hypothetical protein
MSIAIVFHENKQTEQDYVLKKFQKDGFVITKSSIPRMILVHIANDLLEKEAERINLLIHNKQNVLQTFLIENRSQFILNKNDKEIFKPSEKNLLLLSLMEQVCDSPPILIFLSFHIFFSLLGCHGWRIQSDLSR